MDPALLNFKPQRMSIFEKGPDKQYYITRDLKGKTHLVHDGDWKGISGAQEAIERVEEAMNREIKERSGVIYFLTSIGAIGRVNRFFFRLLGSRKHEEIEK